MELLVDEAEQQTIPLPDSDDLQELLDGPPSDLILAARYLKEHLGSYFGNRIEREFGELKPQEVHEIIGQLNLVGIVTTNYDCLLEESLPPGWTPVVPSGESRMNLDQKRFVLKLHGSCRPDVRTVVIDPDDYRRVMQNQWLMATMNRLYANHTFLFVGFGLRDPDTVATLEPLKELFGETARQHYALINGAEVGPIRERDLKERLHVHPLRYSTPDGSHDEVTEFLRRLAGLATGPGAKRNVTRSLLLVGGCAESERSTRLLVKQASRDWEVDGQLPFMIPNLPHSTDLGELRSGASRQLGIAERHLELKFEGAVFATKNKNPALGDGAGVYRFQFVVVTIKKPPADVVSHLARIGDREATWMTLSELRSHRMTARLNLDPLVRLSGIFGSDLENLPVSVRW